MGTDDSDIHLQRLLLSEKLEEPWYKSLIQSVKELVNPPKLPPLELTSTPVPVKDIWGFYGGQEKQAGLTSALIHFGVIGLLLIIGTIKPVQQAVKEHVMLFPPISLPTSRLPSKRISWVAGAVEATAR